MAGVKGKFGLARRGSGHGRFMKIMPHGYLSLKAKGKILGPQKANLLCVGREEIEGMNLGGKTANCPRIAGHMQRHVHVSSTSQSGESRLGACEKNDDERSPVGQKENRGLLWTRDAVSWKHRCWGGSNEAKDPARVTKHERTRGNSAGLKRRWARGICEIGGRKGVSHTD